jgi:hypothetical protein
MEQQPHFEGEVETRWLHEDGPAEDGPDRRMLVLREVSFVGSDGYRWTAHPGDIVDGASIPKVLWPVAGTPLIGRYRRASVVHDVACKRKERTSRAAARLFYEAMVADGVPHIEALEKYTAVRYFGPQWDELGRELAKPSTHIDTHEAALDQMLMAGATA